MTDRPASPIAVYRSRLLRRCRFRGSIGTGESCMCGYWSTDDTGGADRDRPPEQGGAAGEWREGRHVLPRFSTKCCVMSFERTPAAGAGGTLRRTTTSGTIFSLWLGRRTIDVLLPYL
ncbi:MAG: hypothetical protein MZV70_59775 [Desulfobacterales bacterium]|nr:hypothetical protein [Desulfobacterales bacterium]